MGQFDQTARPIAKLDGAAFLLWVLLCVKRGFRLVFLGWDDTRRLVVPGEPDRVNDLVAVVRDEAHPGCVAGLVVEMEDEAEAILWHMAHYEALLGRELNPSCDPEGAAACSVVVNLSGRQKVRQAKPRFGPYGLGIAPMVVDVAGQDAKKTLRLIEGGKLGLTILPFCALMKGAGDKAFIKRWKKAVETEPDPTRRISYLDWALILSELAGWQVDWLRELEGWMDRKSTLIEGWKKEGAEIEKVRTSRANLLRFVQGRWGAPVPEAIRLAVEGTNDTAVLDKWIDAAATARSIAALRRAMELEP
jgi:hypothetical protein